MIKDNKKGITPTDLAKIKEKINLLYSNGEIFNLTFIKGKQKKQKECKIAVFILVFLELFAMKKP